MRLLLFFPSEGNDIELSRIECFCHPDESYTLFIGRISSYNEILRKKNLQR